MVSTFPVSLSKEKYRIALGSKKGYQDAIGSVLTIKERGRSSLACGVPEKNAQAQVNPGRSKRPTPNQQQESTEVVSGASC